MSKQEKKTTTKGCESCLCEQCCAQIPPSSAMTAEGVDYVRYFCGQDCYDLWLAQQKQAKEDEQG